MTRILIIFSALIASASGMNDPVCSESKSVVLIFTKHERISFISVTERHLRSVALPKSRGTFETIGALAKKKLKTVKPIDIKSLDFQRFFRSVSSLVDGELSLNETHRFIGDPKVFDGPSMYVSVDFGARDYVIEGWRDDFVRNVIAALSKLPETSPLVDLLRFSK